MKYKVTQKFIKENYEYVIKVGYCTLQNLLKCENAIAYTTGINGWNADIYEFKGVAIVTGYKTFGNIKPDCGVIEKYEKRAKEIIEECRPNFFATKVNLQVLLHNFVSECINSAFNEII